MQLNVSNVINCIGETIRRLGDRFREHRRDVLTSNPTSDIAGHFNQFGHTVQDMKVTGMMRTQLTKDRKVAEMKLIEQLGTLHPKGINKDFNYTCRK